MTKLALADELVEFLQHVSAGTNCVEGEFADHTPYCARCWAESLLAKGVGDVIYGGVG